MLATGLALASAPVQARKGEPCTKPWPEIVQAVGPAVVSVTAILVDPFATRDRVSFGHGSGLVIDAAGEVLTNAHVVAEAKLVIVTLEGERTVPAERVALDPVLDLALLRLAGPVEGLVAATLGTSAAAEVGDEVLAIGNPFGLGRTASRGIVSALDRVVPITTTSWLSPFIQTDAAVNPGSSGGPLVDACGEVVGIATGMLGQAENIGFAVPIDAVRGALPTLRAHGRVIRPWHGLYGQLYDARLKALLGGPDVQGFLVETVEPGSPAEAIGLEGGLLPVKIGEHEILAGGEIILEVDGVPVRDLATARKIVAGLEVGRPVRFRFWKEGTIREAEVVLPERPLLPQDMARLRDAYRR
ncbi:MAG: trypsin-like peptidase domain-containing protein [Geminicoccaceae bacterium]|nr:trypsin-like peptidase domain-containing protein [Geminicoccaceae bacterium]